MIKNNGLIKWLLIAAFILWFFFIVASYFVVYKPFSPLLLAELGNTRWLPLRFDLAVIFESLLNLLFAAWFGFVALGCGALAWHRSWGKTAAFPNPLEPYLFSTGAGTGIIGLVVLLFGLLGWLNSVALSLLAIALTLASLAGYATLSPLPRPSPSRPLALYATAALFFVTTLALLPPTSWDSLFYHLKAPKLYLEAGRIYGGVDIPHLNFPSLFQMNFLLAMGLRSDIAAQLLHLLFVPLLAGMVSLMATQLLGVRGGKTAVLFLLATPMVLSLGAASYNDLALAFFSLGALYAFLRWRDGGEKRPYLLWAGVFAGLAMSMKYTSFMTPLFIGLALLWHVRQRLLSAWQAVLLYGGAAWLVALPWYIKNAFFTGNPFYPFLFDGLFWDEFRSAAYAEAGTGIGWDILALLRLPYDMTLAVQDASQDGLAGPLFLGLLPLVVFYMWRKADWQSALQMKRSATPVISTEAAQIRTPIDKQESEVEKSPPVDGEIPRLRSASLGMTSRVIKTMLLFSFAHYVVWVFGVVNSQALWQVRLFMVGLLVLIPPLAWVYEAIREWDHPQFSLRNFMNLAIGFVLGMLLLTQFWGWLTVQPWAYLTGAETREQFLTRRLGTHYAAMERINETLPSDAVVLFLWEPRSYYCDLDCRPDSILDEWGHLVWEWETAVQIHAHLQSDTVTHILLWRTGLDFVLENDSKRFLGDVATLDTLLTIHATRIDPQAEDGYELYRLE